VFKIAQEMGVAQYESTLFFSVSMVYDIGFLEIDRNLLLAENLSDAQKAEIRNHVKQGLAQLSFVPEKYMPVFADGVQMHHENMDGTGYPEGLAGKRIPYIARLIRVAESFVALISRRNYHAIYDKESAIGELRNKPGSYDPEIVDVLDRII
jgi:HD-GYP domain-containing protein (c-di-GMP phosphodiesterase class II)